MDNLKKIINFLILIFVFFLPFQTRLIYQFVTLNDLPWEYGTLSFYATEILLWIIILLTFIYLIFNLYKQRKNIAFFSIKKFGLFLFLSLIFILFSYHSVNSSAFPDVTNQFFNRFIGALCLFLAINISNINQNKILLVFWLSGFTQGILSVYQFFSQKIIANKWLGIAEQIPFISGTSVIQTESERWLRAYGSFGSPNFLGFYLALTLIIGFMLYFNSKQISSKLYLFFITVQNIILLGLVFSFSRSAWVSFLIGLLSLIFIFYKKEKKLSFKKLLPFFIFFLIQIFIFYPLISSRISSQTNLEKISISDRLNQKKVSQEIIKNNFISGVGLGMYTYHLAEHYGKPLYGNYEPVHNIYLLTLSEIGLASLVFWAVVILLGFLICKYSLIYFPLYLMVLVVGLFDHYLWTMFTGQVLFWSIFSLSLAKKNIFLKNF